MTGLKGTSLLPGAVLALDSEKGQTRIELGEEHELAFAFHDLGYITLAPCAPFVRSVEIEHTAGSNTVKSAGRFRPHMKGQFFYLDGWVRIAVVPDDSTAVISRSAAATGTTATPIVTMNEVEMTGDALNLTYFDIAYTPRVR